jgi:hypothetical protein
VRGRHTPWREVLYGKSTGRRSQRHVLDRVRRLREDARGIIRRAVGGDAHEHLLDSVSDVRRKFDAGDVDAVRRYAADLMNWFAIHASSEDAELATFLKGEII